MFFCVIGRLGGSQDWADVLAILEPPAGVWDVAKLKLQCR